MLLHERHQGFRLLVVGPLVLQEVAVGDVDARQRLRVVSHKLFGIFLQFGRRHAGHLLAEAVHQLVFFCSLGLQLFQVRGIGFHVYRLSRFGEHRLFREVGKQQHQCALA